MAQFELRWAVIRPDEVKMVATVLKETPLASVHRNTGARMVDFCGWCMPIRYRSTVREHMAVRSKVGLFDVSHMGEFTVQGNDAFDFLQYMIANDLKKLSKPNHALYSQFVQPNGGTVDDLIVYRRDDDFLLVVNACNIDKDWSWLQYYAAKFTSLKLKNISDQTALLALQGPHAVNLMKELAGNFIEHLSSFSYGKGTIGGIPISFGRTGYTGEDGFEIFADAPEAERLWKTIMDHGQKFGIEPCALGARDTLRLEAAYPLYGHELNDHTSPLEAGLGWSVKLDKGEFLGLEALMKQKQDGLVKQCVCLRAEGKALPREGYAVYANDKQIGSVTSGSQGIFVGYPIAFASVASEYAQIGRQLSIEIRDHKVPATVVTRPFYKRKPA
jgi:aminomethyltransferase